MRLAAFAVSARVVEIDLAAVLMRGVPVDFATVAQSHIADGHRWSVGVTVAVRGEAEQDCAHDAAVAPTGAARAADPLRPRQGVPGMGDGDPDAAGQPASGTRAAPGWPRGRSQTEYYAGSSGALRYAADASGKSRPLTDDKRLH